MSVSDISTLSTPRMEAAAKLAEKITKLQIINKLDSGQLRRDDTERYHREYTAIFTAEYYRCYEVLQGLAETSRVIYLPTDNPAAKKFHWRHAPVRFSRTNLLIIAQDKRVIISRFEYPIDDEISPETKEARISSWPGPLDKCYDDLKIRLGEYLDSLIEKDSRRRIRYCNNDEQRITILKLLVEILNGRVTAPVITRLLVKPEQADITDEIRPLEILENHLLLGRPKDAIKFAKTKNLFSHSSFLTFIIDYQERKLAYFDHKDSMMLQNFNDFIKSLNDYNILRIVYRSLMNKILQNDTDSRDIIKHNVGNNAYEFAILSANDCAMEFNQSNEIFKLVTSMKQAKQQSTIGNHLISLGFVSLDNYDNSEDFSYRSFSSFHGQPDTYTARTLKISNIDMLLINEIWEHCLNVARGTCDNNNYEYLINLVPYKLILASKLYDFGLYEMFADYLYSMQRALAKARQNVPPERDTFYDWDTIEQSVEHLAEIWKLHQGAYSTNNYTSPYSRDPVSQLKGFTMHGNNQFNHIESNLQHNSQADTLNSSPIQEHPPMPYQDINSPPQNIPTHQFNQLYIGDEPIPKGSEPLQTEEDNFNNIESGFNPQHNLHHNLNSQLPPPPQNFYNEPPNSYLNDRSAESSRRPSMARSASMDVPPVFSPPSFGATNYDRAPIPKSMTTSSPVDRRDSMQEAGNFMGESFNTPYSPINEYSNDMPPMGDRQSNYPSNNNELIQQKNSLGNEMTQKSSNINPGISSSPSEVASKPANEQQQQQTSSGDQQSGIFNLLPKTFSTILKKSTSSKEMVLPDDRNKDIVWDAEKSQWVDLKNPDGADSMNQNEPPPIVPNNSSNPAPNYSFAPRSAKSRYPKGNF